MIDDLVKLALIGTGRGGTAVALPPGPVADALAGVPTTDAESKLLDAVAVASRYAAAGRVPTAAGDVPAPAAVDVRPACSARAAELLDVIRSRTDTPATQQLLGEWLAHANRAGRRVPHGVIPALLDYAAAHRWARDAIVAAADARGAWLMSLNPKWRVAAAEGDDAATVWSTGTKDQRASALRRLRATDPAAAVALLQSTWKEDGADERAAFVETMSVGLSATDEPFLEACLDDRSKQVRAAAAPLLARLPASAFVARMTARADAILSYADGKVTVALPGAFEKDWERDGLSEKTPTGRGQRQWWMTQIVGFVPPAHWSAAWGVKPAAVLAAVIKEYADGLIGAWTEAAGRHPDPAWVTALVLDPEHRGNEAARVGLIDLLPADAQRSLATTLFRLPRVDADALSMLVRRTTFPFDRPSAEALLVAVDRLMAAHVGNFDYHMPGLIAELGLRLPPDLHDGLAERWAGSGWDKYERAVTECMTILHLRRELQREFAQ